MDQISALLDKAREMCGAKNDSELASKLGVGHTTVSNWRTGRAKPDVVSAEKLAKLTHGNLARIVAMIEEARATSSAAKAVWRKIATAAAILLAVYTSSIPKANTTPTLSELRGSESCLLCKILLAWFARFSYRKPRLTPTDRLAIA